MNSIKIFILRNRFYVINGCFIISLCLLNLLTNYQRRSREFAEVRNLLNQHITDIRFSEITLAVSRLIEQGTPNSVVLRETKKLIKLKQLEITKLRNQSLNRDKQIFKEMKDKYIGLGFDASSLSILAHIPFIHLDPNNEYPKWFNPFFRPFRQIYLDQQEIQHSQNNNNQDNENLLVSTIQQQDINLGRVLLEQEQRVIGIVQNLSTDNLQLLSSLQHQQHNLEMEQIALAAPNATNEEIEETLINSRESPLKEVFKPKDYISVGLNIFKKILFAPSREGYEHKRRYSRRSLLDDDSNSLLSSNIEHEEEKHFDKRDSKDYSSYLREDKRQAKMINSEDDSEKIKEKERKRVSLKLREMHKNNNELGYSTNVINQHRMVADEIKKQERQGGYRSDYEKESIEKFYQEHEKIDEKINQKVAKELENEFND